MLDINLIRTQPDLVKQSVADRQDPAMASRVDEALSLDQRRRDLLKEVEALKAQRNTVSKEISRMKDAGAREAKILEQRQVNERIDALDKQVAGVDAGLRDLLDLIPNLPDARTPVGATEDDNVVLKVVEGAVKELDFPAQAHWDLGPKLGMIDFERGVKLTGSRFYVLTGLGARLQRALIAWMLDLHTRQGYTEVYTPFMVHADILYGAGQLPKFRDNLYRDAEEDLWMVPTAEVPITGLHKDEILEAGALPRRYTGYTPCFRREKIAAGRDVRGIKRGHQFDKVEMYVFCAPEDSNAELERMREHAEATCAQLGFTYRVKLLCTADIGFSARITYDIEVWAPGCGEWLEVSSVSNCGDFQARRANLKWRRAPGAKAEHLHTLNGSGLGLPRTMIAVMENYQRPDGSLVVPEVLRPWMGGVEVIGYQ